MYNKIAPIILNAGKNASFSDVFIAQPDSLKENLAGKIFILAEISAKKNEGRLIFDFIIDALETYYYNDEKILLKDKIEGLKLENIFEAALAKVNKDLDDFLANENIKINVPSTNITIGVVFENKLYFSSFGKNRALLIYRRNDQYEVINVETSATELKEHLDEKEFASPKKVNIFSSVISGEIPINSYFFFTSEALPEYLSNKEILSIITKLPPIVAAEQIKNTLAKINTYVPFLGVLIKNTIGLNISENKEELEETLIPRNAISTLDNTEQKTEKLLAPAGVINLAKIIKLGKNTFKAWPAKQAAPVKKSYKPEEEKTSIYPPIDLGRVKSLNLARSDSFLTKEKIFFKKKPGEFVQKTKNSFLVIVQIFNPRNWLSIIYKFRDWFKGLNPKNSILFGGLIVVTLVFIGSIVFTNITKDNKASQALIAEQQTKIQEYEDSIDTHLLYNDNDGARADLLAAQSLLSSLPHEKDDQKVVYDRLNAKFIEQSEKIQKIVKVTDIEKTNDLSGLNINTIFLSSGNIFASDNSNVYALTVNSSSSTKYAIEGAISLNRAYQNPNEKSFLYFLNDKQIVKFDLKKKTNTKINIANPDTTVIFDKFKIYGNSGNNLYALSPSNNQIFKYTKNSSGYASKVDWLKETVDLSQASDLFVIDGDIYVLKNNGEVQKFFQGKKEDFNAPALLPSVSTASKLVIGTKYIYILDSTSKRLVVLSKINGNLLNQYEVASLNNIKDFSVNEEAKQAYLLTPEAIYRINLNQ